MMADGVIPGTGSALGGFEGINMTKSCDTQPNLPSFFLKITG
jgi:hypothetical protein